MPRSLPRDLPTLALVLSGFFVSFSGCADPRCNHCSAQMRAIQKTAEILAWACGGVFALVFVGGAIATIVKNGRAPTSSSRTLGKLLGGFHMAIAGAMMLSVFSEPPEKLWPSGEIDYVDLVSFVLFGVTWIALGAKTLAAARSPTSRRPPP